MAEQSKSVFYGDNNVGEAVTYKREAPNLFALIESQKEEKKLAKATQAKQTKDDLTIKLGEIYAPAQKEVLTAFDEYTTMYSKLNTDGTANTPEGQITLQTAKVKVEQMANQSRQLQKYIEDKQNTYDKDKSSGLKTINITDEIQKRMYNADGTSKPMSQWSFETFDKEYQDDANNWDGVIVRENFKKVIGKIAIAQTKIGDKYNTNIKTEVDSYFQVDENGKIEVDENQEPIINVTPELIDLIESTDGANVLVESILKAAKDEGFTTYTKADAVRAFLRPTSNISTSEELKTNAYGVAKFNNDYGKEKELDDAHNFWLQTGDMFNGVFKVEDVNSNYKTANGTILQTISSPIDGKVVGIGVDRDNKPIKITAETLYDPTTGIFYLKKSNSEVLSVLDRKTITSEVESFEDKTYRKALVHKPYELFDSKEKMLLDKGIGPQMVVVKEKTQKTSQSTQAKVVALRAKKESIITNELPKVIDLLEKADKFGYWGDSEMSDLNEKLSKIDFQGMSFVDKSVPTSNFTIRINPKDDTKLEVLDETGSVITTVDTNKENLSILFKKIEPTINSKLINEEETPTQTEEIVGEGLND